MSLFALANLPLFPLAQSRSFCCKTVVVVGMARKYRTERIYTCWRAFWHPRISKRLRRHIVTEAYRMANPAASHGRFRDVNCYTVERDKEYEMRISEVARLVWCVWSRSPCRLASKRHPRRGIFASCTTGCPLGASICFSILLPTI